MRSSSRELAHVNCLMMTELKNEKFMPFACVNILRADMKPTKLLDWKVEQYFINGLKNATKCLAAIFEFDFYIKFLM